MTTTTPEIDLTGPRWSAAVVCARRCVYGARGAPSDEPTIEMRRFWERGKAWERIVSDGIVSRMIEEGRRPRRQEIVSWPAAAPVGTGHVDVYVPHEHEVVEIVSNARGTLPEHKALQAAGYALNHPRAENATVRSVDTHTGEEHIYPIDVSGLEPKIREIELQVVAGLEGELPERVCRTPWDGPAVMCAHVSTCFADWTPTPLDELLASAGEQDLVDRLADAEDEVGRISEALASAKTARDELRDKVAPLVEPGVEAFAGDIRVRRGADYARRGFQLKAFLDAGHPVPDILWPFVTESIVPGRWSVKRVDP